MNKFDGNRPTVAIAVFSAGIILVFFVYLALYLPLVKKETREWSIICPVLLFLSSDE